MPVLERAGEERRAAAPAPRASARYGAEADDDEPRVDAAPSPRAAPARPSARSASRSRRPSARRRRGTPRAARRCRRRAAAPRRSPGSAGRARASASRPASASSRSCSTNSSTSTPGGTSMHAVDLADDVLEHLADVLRADERRLGVRERSRPPALELGPPAHRVLELRAVRLDAERRAGRRADRRRPAARGSRTRGRRAGARAAPPRSPRRTRRRSAVGEVLQQLRLEPRVAVEHEHGQQPARQLRRRRPSRRRGRTARAARSWQTTTTSCPARLHSRASARV